MMLPISTELLLSEIKSARDILDGWVRMLEEEGIPVLDMPAPQDRLADFVNRMCGELMICSGKCENLVSTLSNHE